MRAALEQLCQFEVFINRPHGFDEARPVGSIEKFRPPCCFITCEITTSLL